MDALHTSLDSFVSAPAKSQRVGQVWGNQSISGLDRWYIKSKNARLQRWIARPWNNVHRATHQRYVSTHCRRNFNRVQGIIMLQASRLSTPHELTDSSVIGYIASANAKQCPST